MNIFDQRRDWAKKKIKLFFKTREVNSGIDLMVQWIPFGKVILLQIVTVKGDIPDSQLYRKTVNKNGRGKREEGDSFECS